jgi:hypothetical protein
LGEAYAPVLLSQGVSTPPSNSRCAAAELPSFGPDAMWFEVIGDIRDVESIALGRSIRVRQRLRKLYGGVYWRKLKGVAKVRLPNGRQVLAEIHWYEAHGIGRREMKFKRFLKS